MKWFEMIVSIASAIASLNIGIAANVVYGYIRDKLNDRRK